jgi:deoxyribose-phosphate aldolase
MRNEEQRNVAARALPLIDLTDLTDTCRPTAIDALCQRAMTPFGPVAAICIWPRFVTHAVRALVGTNIKIATVINFPHGGDDIERAVSDCRETVRDGATEIDLVMPYRAFLAGRIGVAGDLIRAVADEVPAGKCLKVILETGALKGPEKIAEASQLAIASGANFLKTSTGKIAVSATLEAATIMLNVIRKQDREIGLKAAGGIRQVADAGGYLELCDQIMGRDWANPAHFRFGASALLDTVLACLAGQENQPAGRY